jgi:hypothetical protein
MEDFTMDENKIYYAHCGALIENDDYVELGGEIVCSDCYEHHTTICGRCGSTIFTESSYGDEYTTLCEHCYNHHYTRCSCCDTLIHEDDAYHLDGYDYCSECYHEEVDKNKSIHDYSYEPEPVFYGDSKRFFGVELMNYSTIEFRMFKGTLKLNTFLATLELVNAIINVALDYSEDGLHKLSWSEFVSSIREPELIAYLKERRLYINESTETEEDL